MSGPPWRFKGMGGNSGAYHEAHYDETRENIEREERLRISEKIAEEHAKVAIGIIARFKKLLKIPTKKESEDE